MATNTVVISELRTRLQRYIAAETACLKNQSYTIKDRTYTRADLAVLARTIKDLRKDLALAEQGGMRVRRIVPRD